MARHSAAARVQRLEQLKGLLRSREHVTSAELSHELGVSLRTMRRDLELLRDAGVPIEAERGRGGGLRMHRNWAFGGLHLSSAEAIDLLLSIAIAERMNSPVFLRQLAAIKRKIVAGFSAAHHAQIRSLRQRILIGQPASGRVLESYVPFGARDASAIGEAFLAMQCVTIEYVNQNGTASSRVIEPQFLYLNVPVWYLLAWDRLRGAVRYFRIDRIRSVHLLQESFRLGDPRIFLAEAERGIQAL